MTSPTRNGGHGLVYAIATEALPQAEDLEAEASKLEQAAADKRRAARRRALRQVTQMLRTADAVRSICDAVHQRRSADLRLDMIRVPGDTDAEIVDALIGDGHHHRRSEA